ncbi:MAG: hypothetical protein B6229_09925 [Spirochaetaceae bacterium 4572_7]|nr:MAG: hypothetical protein B6229_09925 [Spirochaetaceae bacterium 4572_7]
MPKFKFLVVFSIIFSSLFLSCVSGPKLTELSGDINVDLSAAEIYSVNPTTVLPGTMMYIAGSGFGDIPGVINIGGIDVTTFLEWTDDVIWFRAPEGLTPDSEVQVGYEIAESFITPAPEGSITVKWILDAGKFQADANEKFTKYGLEVAPVWMAPLYIKGEWSKSAETYGLKDAGWDGGSRQNMLNVAGTDIWMSEAIFTPEAMDTFDNMAMKFAFEDGDNETRNLSPYESDIACMLKKEWAAAIGASGDPITRMSEENTLFDADSRSITIEFPLKK